MKQMVISLWDYWSACDWEYGNAELRKELLSLNTKEIKINYWKQEVTIYYETN